VSLGSSNQGHCTWLGMWNVWEEKRTADRILVELLGRKTFFGGPLLDVTPFYFVRCGTMLLC